ncbi:aldo/keto reductase family domain-containing protein [Ditylenchus destructor]|uniref:Aldo/keto reductase family domain-containing protein n=1 Tax=Ditylenchus destructor TaxID=166010 RepID=A0AAD4NDJ7_9BILA|nr:aldo/keto reductase family domain-containing protein [Ditylenchus destructor]
MSAHTVTTSAGINMPRLIYGTAWKKERTTELVVQAILAGFRAIDTACQPKHYQENLVGEALSILKQKHGIAREDLFVQTKFTSLSGQDPQHIPYDQQAPLQNQVRQSYTRSLANLQTNYIDSLVMHGPMRTHEETMKVWRVEIRRFCQEHGMVYQSFWTLTANPHILRSQLIREIASKRSATPEQIFFRYVLDIGIAPLTGTTSQQHMKQDLAVLDMPPLSKEEIAQIDQMLG